MATRDRENSNRPSVPGKGNPSDVGKSKAQIKNVQNLDNLDEHEEIKDKYTSGLDSVPGDVIVNNPNRNTDKPDIDKPSY
jgi:hypothetical protein